MRVDYPYQCPLCGSEAVLEKRGCAWQVSCLGCGVNVGRLGIYEGKKKVIKVWNTRRLR
jgi:uncharacterized Zn finger protein